VTNSCHNKRRYKIGQAESVLLRMNKQHCGAGLTIYRCSFGKHYHIGHQIGGEEVTRGRKEHEMSMDFPDVDLHCFGGVGK